MRGLDEESIEELRWEIRLHGRGGQGVVTASKILAESAFAERYHAQSIPFFGAERRGSPVMAFTRISEHEIRERSQIYTPDCVLILDPLVMRVLDVFNGLKDGGGVVISTSSRISDEILPDISLTLVVVDGVGIALKKDLLVAGNPVVNIPVIGAFLRVFPHIGIETVEKVISEKFKRNSKRSVKALYSAYESAEVLKIRGKKRAEKVYSKKPGKIWIPASKPVVGVAGKTGYWRDFRPVINYSRCTNCLNCWIHCPEGSIRRENGEVVIDYDYCKGCLVCLSVCPRRAISSEREVFA